MGKDKCLCLGVVVVLIVFSTSGSLCSGFLDDKNAKDYVKDPDVLGAVLEVSTDKEVYGLGQSVAIFLTNVGDELLSGGGPIVTIYDSEGIIVYQEATYCWYELEPGEYVSWPPWDQTNQQGQQVPVGEYVVEGFLSGYHEDYCDTAIFYISNGPEGELDQLQPSYDIGCFAPVGNVLFGDINVSFAQSFKPTKEVLMRVELYMARNFTVSYPLVVAIREDLTGADLAVDRLDPEDFPVFDFENSTNLEWIEISFDGVWLNVNQTYYIVTYTTNVTGNWYVWGASCSDVYADGEVFFSVDDGILWEDEPYADMCFKTYGLEETFLQIVFGSSFPGFSFTIKNVGNATAYNIRVNVNTSGGLVLLGRSKSFYYSELEPGGELHVKFFVLGIGRIELSVTASALNARIIYAKFNGFLILFYFIIR